MKQSVIVNGVTLSREQVEKALQELNAPAQFEPGDIVTSVCFGSRRFLVVGGDLSDVLAKRYGSVAGDSSLVRVTDAYTTWVWLADKLTKVGRLQS